MGHEERSGAASLHGLARVQRERQWTSVLDIALAFTIVLWIGGLAFSAYLPAKIEAFLPVVIGVMVVHRLLVVLERHRREHEHVASPRSDIATDVTARALRRPAGRSHAA